VSREPQVEQPPQSFRRSLVVLLLVVVAPAVLVGLVAGGVAARAFPVGIVGGLLIITGAGPAAGVRFLVVLPVVLAVSLLTVGSWWWVVLFAVVGAAVGVLAQHGLALAMVQIGLVASTVPQLEGWSEPAVFVAFLLLGELFGLLLARRAALTSVGATTTVATVPQAVAAAVGAVGVGTSAAVAIAVGGDHSYWFVVMFLVVAQLVIVDARGGRRAVGQRLLGTCLGVAGVVPLAMVLPRWSTALAALVLVAFGMSQPSSRYWLASAAISAAVVLVAAPADASLALGARRVLATVVAVGLLGAVSVALRITRGSGRAVPPPPPPPPTPPRRASSV
jgi:hypothetical protein